MNMRPVIVMVVGGLVLTLLLYTGLSLADRPAPNVPSVSTNGPVGQEASLTPVTFTSVSENVDAAGTANLRLQGMAEPNSVIVLLDRGETIRQVRTDESGSWSALIEIPPQPMAIEAVMFDRDPDSVTDSNSTTPNGSVSIRGVETIFHIRRVTEDNPDPPALILITSPGAPSRLIQSPFGRLPDSSTLGEGPLFIGPIDYDDAGGVIFSGLSAEQGRVRIYVSNSAIGDTRVGPDGRWAYIAGSAMPLGESDIRAELIRDQRERVSVSVPFERLAPLPTSDGDDGALSVIFEPTHWQIRRALIGGGSQSTAIFSPTP